ncbi:MAG: hypothetical protein LIO92_02875, partial [Clostridiales bacterium]|nr:hypothetical protein [Clostridiales bacterium]
EGDLDGYYDSLVGDYVTSITYYTSSGIYELTFEDGVYVGNVIVIDGVEVITDALYNEDGSIDLTNTELFSEGADGAYLVTVGGITQLVGNTTLEKWVGSYENWQSWIYPSEELLEQYPYLEEAWDLAYEAYIAAFEAYGMGDYIKALYSDTDSLKAYWYSMTDTYGVEYMEVEETADGSYVLSWLDADGNVLASDSYTMTGKVLNGLEGAIMYVFTADNLDEGSEYKYWVTMEPDMEGTTEFPIAAHFHFQYGSDIESLLVYGQLYNDTTKNIADRTWYATMIDADADALAKYNVILGMHMAEKWSELPEEDDDLNNDNTGDESSSNTDNTGDSGNSGESSETSSSSSSGRPASSNATSHGSSSGGSGSSSSASSGSTWVQDVENNDNTWWLRRTDGSYVTGSVTTDESGNAHEQIAWAQVNGAWYAFGSDGYADQGWVLDYAAGKWYFIDINTGMKSGWHHDDQDNYWYYLDPSSGAMRIGWNQIDGNWYYFNSNPLTYTWNYDESAGNWVYDTSSVSKPLGAMYAGETTPDGYVVDENGTWIQ